MQSGKQTPSVIARLMGLDDLPTQPPIHKRRRVLSENYLRKTASIGQFEKGRFCLNRSSRSSNHQQRSKDGVEEETTMIRRNSKLENANSRTPMSCIRQQSRGGKHILRSLQKLDNDSISDPNGKFRIDDLHKLVKSRLDMKQKTRISPTRTVVLKSNAGAYDIFLSGNRKNSGFLRDVNERRINGTEHIRQNNKRSDAQEVLSRQELTLECSSNRSRLVSIAEKRIFERWRTTKFFEEGEVASKRCTLGEILANSDMERNPKSLSNKLNDDNFCKLKSDLIDSSTGSLCSCVADGPSSDEDISSSEFKDLQFESMPSSLVKDDDTLEVLETSNGQKSSNGFHVEGFGFSNSNRKVPTFHMDLGEHNQPSPNSVLDPSFQEDSISISEAFDRAAADFYSLPMRLRLQKSTSEETYSVGSEMVVSSDEDTWKGSVALSLDSGKQLGPFQAEESRIFSYLVDVLDEAGFTATNLERSFGIWHSLEYPVSPSVFEELEKKYGKQMYWHRSERRLLFDQINEGLKEILNLFIDINMWAKPLRKRFIADMRRDEVEEELWTTLINGENEACKDLSEKALNTETKWLELREDIYAMCREIENDLFDVLVGELADIEGV